jgi:hypothetical protein
MAGFARPNPRAGPAALTQAGYRRTGVAGRFGYWRAVALVYISWVATERMPC